MLQSLGEISKCRVVALEATPPFNTYPPKYLTYAPMDEDKEDEVGRDRLGSCSVGRMGRNKISGSHIGGLA